MKLSRLELFGFKSFGKRTVVSFSEGLTGIVGPNGCGKSNIVDALRWLMGESHAKTLRGAKLEDLIFSGSSALRQLGLAEVSLIIRAEGESLLDDIKELQKNNAFFVGVKDKSFIKKPSLKVIKGSEEDEGFVENLNEGERVKGEQELKNGVSTVDTNAFLLATDSFESLSLKYPWLGKISEVQVTRRVYRSGETEFLINNVPCRLRDIRELFRVMGLAARSFTVVGQGEIADILNAKPQERRKILEEAAGIAGFKEKITITERRLEETELNLKRLKELIQELEKKVSFLKRQVSRAEKKEKIKEELERADT
ncbi:MAG: hypothetical protein D6780_07510, partial [Candidatus Dadabacteria bacterium]